MENIHQFKNPQSLPISGCELNLSFATTSILALSTTYLETFSKT